MSMRRTWPPSPAPRRKRARIRTGKSLPAATRGWIPGWSAMANGSASPKVSCSSRKRSRKTRGRFRYRLIDAATPRVIRHGESVLRRVCYRLTVKLEATFPPALRQVNKERAAPFYFQNQPPYHNKENGNAETSPAREFNIRVFF